MEKRVVSAGILLLLATGIFGAAPSTAGTDDRQESAFHSPGRSPDQSPEQSPGQAPEQPASLENLRLLERSSFEPSREIWTYIADSSDGTTALGLLARGALALEAGAIDEARHAFEAAQAANGGSPYPYYYLGRIELDHGNPAGAVESLQESVRRRRDFAAAYRLLGRAFMELGATPQAFTALRTVIALAPGLAGPHLELGRAYLEHGRPAHAVIELQRATELDEQPLESLYLLGRARLNAGMIEQGFADLEAYVLVAADVPAERERLSHARLLLRRFAGGTF